MEAITTYFSDIPTLHRTLLLVGGLTIFFLIESAVPLFAVRHNKWKHTAINIFFTLTTIIVNFSMAFLLVKTSIWVEESGIGLFQMINMPLVIMIFGGVFLMDFVGAWLPHFLEHKIKWMWQFHLIHHTDQHVSTTTANRHHPGESVIRFAFTLLAVVIMGAPLWMVFLYQSCSLVATQFSHSNVKMPSWLDNSLSWFLVTPNVHRVHHHYRQPYSDTNFGNIFSVWDRALGTFAIAKNEELVYGVDTHMDHKDAHDLWTLLKMPFTKYREPIHYDKEEVLSK